MLDEFREDTITKYRQSAKQPWLHWGPSVTGTSIAPCFRGGFLFRIYSQETGVLSLYNDTHTYEMHCCFVFAPGAVVEVLCPSVAVEESAGGEKKLSVVVYPMETVTVLKGKRGQYRSTYDGKALSSEYLEREMKECVTSLEEAEGAIAHHTSSTSAEEVLDVCKRYNLLFVDPEFPPTRTSLDGGTNVLHRSSWQRPVLYLPKHLRDQVRLFRRDVAAHRVDRGELGNAWVLSAVAALSEFPDSVRCMFRHPMKWSETAVEDSLGAYRVLLNTSGRWKSFLVDSYLPVRGKQPRFAKCSRDPCEMWIPYLEKAYAKRLGSYANILCGDPLVAMRDMTGFPTTRLDALWRSCAGSPESSTALFDRLATDCENGHQVLLSTPNSGLTSTAAASSMVAQGVLPGFAYAVVSMIRVSQERLLRVRNPWGNVHAWRGRWHSSSSAWNEFPEVREAVSQYHSEDDDHCILVDWAEAVRLFVGCGVVFNHFGYVDYRIAASFSGSIPSVCLEVSVTEPTHLTFILSQRDHRMEERLSPARSSDIITTTTNCNSNNENGSSKYSTSSNNDYAPVVLSIAQSSAARGKRNGKANNNSHTTSSSSGGAAATYSLVVSSSWDAENPTKDSFVFMQGRDISIMHTFEPAHSPYLVIPRRLQPSCGHASSSPPREENKNEDNDDNSNISRRHTCNTVSGAAQHKEENLATAASFNCTNKSISQGKQCLEKEMPFVLGVLSQLPFTRFGKAHVRFRQLPAENAVFRDYVRFSDDTVSQHCAYQVKHSPTKLTEEAGVQLNPTA